MERLARMPSTTIDNPLQAAAEHHRAGRLAQAEQLYCAALSHNPNDAAVLHLLGVLAGQTGRTESGIRLIRKAISLAADVAAYHNNLANLLREQGRLSEAIEAYREAVRINPQYAEAHANLGHVLGESGRHEEAAEHYATAAELKPDCVEFQVHLADCLVACERFLDAADAYTRAISLSPEPGLRNNLGVVLRDLGRFDEAIEEYQTALASDPSSAETWNNLGVALADAGRLDEALDAFGQAILLKPGYADAHSNLGATLYAARRPSESLAASRQAVEMEPHNGKYRSNLGLILLGCGEYEQGWAEYEWRYRCNPRFKPREFAQPTWDGGDLEGRTILLHAEQGFGDTLQFCRFVPEVQHHAAEVVLEVQPELVRLLQYSMPQVRVIGRGESLPKFDVHCPLMSLPHRLGTTLGSIPSAPYLFAGSKSVFSASEDRLNVGLVWAGRPTHSNDRNRSMRFEQLLRLGDITTVAYHSLQKGPAAAQSSGPVNSFPIVRHALDGLDFLHTAELIAGMDLVISVDTAVAHLAAAMGKPVWLLLPFAADWRWMVDREDSPWYPTMRLFRQKRWGDWDEVIGRVADKLARLSITSSTRADRSSSAEGSDRSRRDRRRISD